MLGFTDILKMRVYFYSKLNQIQGLTTLGRVTDQRCHSNVPSLNHLHHDALPVLHVRLFSHGNSRMAIKSNKATGPPPKHGTTGANVPGLGYGTADHTDVLTWPPHLSGFPLLPERHLGIRRLECGFRSPLKLCVKAVRVLSIFSFRHSCIHV